HRPDHQSPRGRPRLGSEAGQGRLHRARGGRGPARARRRPQAGGLRDGRARGAAARLSPDGGRRPGGRRDLRLVRPLGRALDRHGLRAIAADRGRHRFDRRDPRRPARGAGGEDPVPSLAHQEGLGEASRANVPAELKYTREHEWAKVEGDRARIGITAFAQEQLGDVVFVELPKVGAKVTAMKTFGVVESVKAVSDLFAPLSGEVVEANTEVTKKPETVNSDPYGQGWMIVIKLSNSKEMDGLMSAADYEKLTAGGG